MKTTYQVFLCTTEKNGTVFENRQKSRIHNCFHFKWTTVHQKCQKWSILVSFWKSKACSQTVLPDRSILIGHKIGRKCQNSKKCDLFPFKVGKGSSKILATFWTLLVIFRQCGMDFWTKIGPVTLCASTRDQNNHVVVKTFGHHTSHGCHCH